MLARKWEVNTFNQVTRDRGIEQVVPYAIDASGTLSR